VNDVQMGVGADDDAAKSCHDKWGLVLLVSNWPDGTNTTAGRADKTLTRQLPGC
jgi:hypothetical protein